MSRRFITHIVVSVMTRFTRIILVLHTYFVQRLSLILSKILKMHFMKNDVADVSCKNLNDPLKQSEDRN